MGKVSETSSVFHVARPTHLQVLPEELVGTLEAAEWDAEATVDELTSTLGLFSDVLVAVATATIPFPSKYATSVAGSLKNL